MTVSVSLLLTAVVLCAVGGVLMLTRPLTRILLGAVIASNGINLLVLASTGRAGEAPLLYGVALGRVTDPLPQAIALTAIVITLATTAFLLAMAYRGHQLTGTDEVHDDLEDRRIVLRAEVRGEWAELREEYRAEPGRTSEDRDRYREERGRLRARLRADRALQARGRDASGDLWHDILGADPDDYPDASLHGARPPSGTEPADLDPGAPAHGTGADPSHPSSQAGERGPEDPGSGGGATGPDAPGDDGSGPAGPGPDDGPGPEDGPGDDGSGPAGPGPDDPSDSDRGAAG
ncbi:MULTISPECIES: Na(+)/H(+) antiporter subunit C [unclassified Streptomyces]|uniref:Na(+)/H(+) antiporter subunit C n=1 Tax=unclassified Streptomyces TaxID=2593676 RepID=UPI00081B9994|nr:MULTISPECIES: Na(+)/H(+) antiporter subunit C [unclassified Streptomyces]MYQ52197.1 Na(+)/H(+) antiporter subunit C [Streptomyces sp. SID4941]SCD77535.1 multisubunit sodium/proton antiporter, MrpC subunit [Streptomyces sp. PalvLS-984]SDB87815.1 multisubunit sodium/proton antiporter, MrpC subunit (TC 2.A.63.1) [Streptomyces sp. AmelKG-A3]